MANSQRSLLLSKHSTRPETHSELRSPWKLSRTSLRHREMTSASRANTPAHVIPPLIWMYWDSGFELAPPVVKLCLQSWEALNPDFQIIALDARSVRNYSELPGSVANWQHLTPQLQSDLIRLDLLGKFGGVWVDSTLFCSRPLADWIPTHPASGLLAPRPSRGSDKLLSTFFLASTPRNAFITKWGRLLTDYVEGQPRPMPHKRLKRLSNIFPLVKNPVGRVMFTTRFARDRWGAPYFLVHYFATRVIISSLANLIRWIASPRLEPGKFSSLLRTPNAKVLFEEHLREKSFAVWKLTHKPLPDQAQLHQEIESAAREFLRAQYR